MTDWLASWLVDWSIYAGSVYSTRNTRTCMQNKEKEQTIGKMQCSIKQSAECNPISPSQKQLKSVNLLYERRQ